MPPRFQLCLLFQDLGKKKVQTTTKKCFTIFYTKLNQNIWKKYFDLHIRWYWIKEDIVAEKRSLMFQNSNHERKLTYFIMLRWFWIIILILLFTAFCHWSSHHLKGTHITRHDYLNLLLFSHSGAYSECFAKHERDKELCLSNNYGLFFSTFY